MEVRQFNVDILIIYRFKMVTELMKHPVYLTLSFLYIKMITNILFWMNYIYWYTWLIELSIFNFWNYFVWLRITDEGSVPEMRIWSILLIKSDLKWSIHLSRSLFLYFSTTWWVSLLVDQWVPEGTCSQVLWSTSVES